MIRGHAREENNNNNNNDENVLEGERVNSKIANVGEQKKKKKKKKTAANSRNIKGKFEGWTCKFPLFDF